MAEEPVLVSVQRNVATVTLNRPEVLNALDLPSGEALVRAMEMCRDDDRVRAMILTGAGRGFCAGGDVKAMWQGLRTGKDPATFFRDLTVPLHRLILDLRNMEKPIVAAINGPAGGAGMSLAAACDLRLAAETATFRQAYTSIGLTPDGGWTALIPQIIGPAKAMELLLLDPVLDARQALALGLVHEVVPGANLAERANAVAARLAQGPSMAFGGAKALLNAALFPNLEAQIERERQRIILQGGTADFREGVAAFVEKRAPRFRGA